MSWDVMVYNFGGMQPDPDPACWEAQAMPLGPAAEVRARISACLPGVDWSNPTWGAHHGEGFSIEFNMGKDDPVDAIMLHVRGGGDAVAAIMAFARLNGWLAEDGSGEFLDPDSPSSAGWGRFQAFRDQVVEALREEGCQVETPWQRPGGDPDGRR